MLTHGSLFSGIGGFDISAQWAGWENVFHCEWNEFGKKVLNYYWPKAISYDDITKTDFTIHRGTIDVLTGGFPCQPYSQAGKRLGKEDERHLWPEMLRAIREIQPRWVVGENVRGLITWNGGLVFDEVQADLEAAGYEVLPFLLPASGVNAPHERYRIWFVAYNHNGGRSKHKLCTGRNLFEEWIDSTGITTDTDISSARSSGESTSIEGSRRRDDDEPKEWRGTTELNIGSPEFLRNAANTERKGFQKPKQSEQFKQLLDAERNDSQYDVANTMHNRPQRSLYPREDSAKRRENENGHIKYRLCFNRDGIQFDNFPTQSPVCGRNDGVSSGLAGITFSKHRNESIKAFGNAVVPQLVFQIFKAINQYENETTR